MGAFGVPTSQVTDDLDILEIAVLRLANFDPIRADEILEQSTMEQIYKAYLMYSFDKLPDPTDG